LGYTVNIVGFCFGEEPQFPLDLDLPIYYLQGDRYPAFVQQIRALLPKIDGDLIYAYKPKPSSFGVALLKQFLTHRPVVLDIDDWELSWHGGDQWRYAPSPVKFIRDLLSSDGELRQPDHPLYLKWMESWVQRATVVTTHTRFMQERFGGIYVPNGKDTQLFNPANYDPVAMKQRYGLTPYRVLMFPGAPRPYKGVEDLIAALDLLNIPDLRLVIVGGSPYDDYDEKLMAVGDRWIIKLPRVAYDQMPGIIAAADMVVVPQRDTPAARAQFSLKLTDGMAMAKPILATRVGDIPNILGNTGYLVDAGTPQQIADTIRWMLEHWDEAIARGQQARKRCIDQYSIDAMASILEEPVQDCLKSMS
jgi:glycosyltransferase involved in cell wall biosynthesis